MQDTGSRWEHCYLTEWR